MMLLFLQTIVILCHHANAWSVIIPARRSGSLLVGSLHTASSLLFAKEEVHGECEDSSSTTDSASSLSRKPVTGDVVTFTFESFEPISDMVLEPPLFDTGGTRQLVLNGGNYLPGLHKLLSTMTPGESVNGVNIDAGYGAYKKELAFDVSTSDFGDMDTSQIKIGTMLQMQNGIQCRVTKIENDKWTLDANHPLAGAAYGISVKLDTVENGPANMEYVKNSVKDDKYKVATFGLGCFWGGELMFQRVPGVISTSVGYTQGTKENPTYEEVCTGSTGHTEAIQVVFDPAQVSYESLVQQVLDRLGDDVYKLNQVGNDRGTQYRSGVYYHDDEQKEVAGKLFGQLGSDDKVVQTELKEATIYYKAEDYHQQYLLKGGQSAKKEAKETIRCYG